MAEEEKKSSPGWLMPVAVFLALYVGFFAAVLVDEAILGTNWFSRNLGDTGEKIFQILYAPFIELVRLLN